MTWIVSHSKELSRVLGITDIFKTFLAALFPGVVRPLLLRNYRVVWSFLTNCCVLASFPAR